MYLNRDTKFMLIAGYGWSGSSAIVDLLKEYKGVWEPDVEFRLIKDPYGLIDLKYNLLKRKDPINNDIAIKDFIWICKHLNQNSTKIKPGLGYKSVFGNSFMYETKEFISKLVDFEYSGNWFLTDFKKTNVSYLVDKIRNKVKFQSKEKMMFSKITETQFNDYAKEYLIKLFDSISNGEIDSVVLDQAIPALMPETTRDYFDNGKLLIIDRDPRDIYVDLIRCRGLIGRDLATPGNASKYVDWHRRMRNKKDIPYVKYMQFEDLVLDYDKSLGEIEEFFELDSNKHTKKLELFNPDISRKNIGIWKEFERQDEIQLIEKELKADLYDR